LSNPCSPPWQFFTSLTHHSTGSHAASSLNFASFLCAGTEKALGGKCKLNMKKFCRPLSLGGLDVLDWDKFSIARFHWPWLERKNPPKHGWAMRTLAVRRICIFSTWRLRSPLATHYRNGARRQRLKVGAIGVWTGQVAAYAEGLAIGVATDQPPCSRHVAAYAEGLVVAVPSTSVNRRRGPISPRRGLDLTVVTHGLRRGPTCLR
jgi:hypothetical protein